MTAIRVNVKDREIEIDEEGKISFIYFCCYRHFLSRHILLDRKAEAKTVISDQRIVVEAKKADEIDRETEIGLLSVIFLRFSVSQKFF